MPNPVSHPPAPVYPSPEILTLTAALSLLAAMLDVRRWVDDDVRAVLRDGLYDLMTIVRGRGVARAVSIELVNHLVRDHGAAVRDAMLAGRTATLRTTADGGAVTLSYRGYGSTQTDHVLATTIVVDGAIVYHDVAVSRIRAEAVARGRDPSVRTRITAHEPDWSRGYKTRARAVMEYERRSLSSAAEECTIIEGRDPDGHARYLVRVGTTRAQYHACVIGTCPRCGWGGNILTASRRSPQCSRELRPYEGHDYGGYGAPTTWRTLREDDHTWELL